MITKMLSSTQGKQWMTISGLKTAQGSLVLNLQHSNVFCPSDFVVPWDYKEFSGILIHRPNSEWNEGVSTKVC